MLERGHPAAVRADPEVFEAVTQGGPHPTVMLFGPLDSTHDAEMAAHLEVALTEAIVIVTVDLTYVTLLASAGVDVLFRISGQARANNLELQIIAPNGSPAQHVLSLVDLPHRHRASPS